MTELRRQLSNACKKYAEARIARFNATMKELEEALKPESRSCMGDKYETSRAMLHLEFEKISGQVELFNNLKKTANLTEHQPITESIGFGSAVKTSGANYFISIPAGEISAGDEKYYSVGINSPVAQLLKGKKAGDTFVLNGKTINILEVD